MAFKKDLRTGHKAENYIMDVLAEAGLPAQANVDPKHFSDYDLQSVLNGRFFTLEAKYDKYENRSGNIAIEFFNPKTNRPTGIDATKADLWVHVLANPMSAWVTTVASLRRYIRDYDPIRVIERGGDDNSSMLLYDRETIFKDIFHRLDGRTPPVTKTLLSKLLGPKYKAGRPRCIFVKGRGLVMAA